ncbi:MAG: pyrroline-5-carboxylate reductase [Methanomicrobiales archaeon HGW-Methanomicrobiales-4]|nr:MAG: pyrroline-5-carboxylate reductase [Methanomicrobiales archaeon HGW-Methanomicrobiales-4]
MRTYEPIYHNDEYIGIRMRTIGFIGYGKMNQMLAMGFLRTGVLQQNQIAISTRTWEKVSNLTDSFPDIRLIKDNRDLAEVADIIFIGVRPLEVLPVLDEIHDVRDGDVHIVSLAACVKADLMASVHPGRISRVLPSICSTVNEGISLIYHHPAVQLEEAAYVQELLSSLSRVIRIDEELFEPAGDLMSCGPALITRILMEFAAAGSRHSTLSQDACLEMVTETAFGTIRLLQEGVHPEDLISRVATPGGITEEGVKILEQDLPQVFDRLFDTTLAKYELVRGRVAMSRNEVINQSDIVKAKR